MNRRVDKIEPGTITEREGGLSKADHLIKVVLFCKKVNHVCNIESSRFKPVSTRMSPSARVPPALNFF
jgi:hypothetical protein